MVPKPRFTLADDDEKFLTLMHHLLARAFPDSSISSFSRAEDALSHVVNMGADLIVTDHAIGTMTGTQLIEELRKRGADIPIIMVSGNPKAEKEAMTAGANEFLHKDFVLNRLVERVKKHLPADVR
jgi:DNA-binding NtrC family response regulator